MKIVDVWIQNNDTFAYCIGDGIDANFSCKKISSNGTSYNVEGFDVMTSISGNVGVVLKIAGNSGKELQNGPFQIVN